MIRAADLTDADRLTWIAGHAFAPFETMIGRMPAPALQDFPADIARGRVWVTGAPVAGYVVAFAKGDDWFLENVAVAPDAQGRGLGRALITFAEAEGARREHGAITLYTNAAMEANLALYPALGYAETARRTEDGFDRVYFRKVLR